jgi:hypothetical protein
MNQEVRSFDQYFELYLQERQNPWTRRLQLMGTTVALGCVAGSLLTGQRTLLLGAAAAAFGPTWFSQRFIEKKNPKSSRYLRWRLRADLLLWTQTLQAALSGGTVDDVRAVLAARPDPVAPVPRTRASDKVDKSAKLNGHSAPAADTERDPIHSRATASRGWAVWQ